VWVRHCAREESSVQAKEGARVAIYHLSVKPVKRAAGRVVTAAAAYRAGDRVRDVQSGQVFDYTRRRGVLYEEIVLPADAARRDINWARDRTALWNAAEAAERRKDARVGREYEMALPHELTHAQRVALVQSFAQDIANRYGSAVDVALHAPHPRGDQRNFHAHLLATTRTITPVGLGAKTAVEWSDTDRRKHGLEPGAEEIEFVRAHWENLTNAALRIAEHSARVDHRSLAAQGIDRVPTTHRGPAITALERRGIRTEVSWRLQAEATQRLERAADVGRREREATPAPASVLALDADVTGARRARETDAAVALRAQADRALDQWQRRQTHTPAQERDHAQDASLAAAPSRERDTGHGIHYDPWDHGF
jgi:ATP-dependent exoDNAse (exonuclease V) alpha subunit